jgi:hypothetical protein
MTLLALLVHAAVHVTAWAWTTRWLVPRWRVAVALAFPPLVPLHWWERSIHAPDARERRRALWTALVWVASLLGYVVASSLA